MPIYTLQAPDGKTYEIEGPEGATADDLSKVIQTEANTVKPYEFSPGFGGAIPALMNVGQSLSFGFGDEIAGKLGLDKDRYLKTIEEHRKDYPVSSMIGSISGASLIPFGAGARAAAHPWLTAATTGMATGALQGAGDADTLEQAGPKAALGGLTGMAAAPMLMFGLNTGGNVLSAVGSKLKPSWATDIARRRVATAIDRDGLSIPDVERSMVNLGAESRVADAAGENVRGTLDLNANLPGRTKNDLETLIRNRQATRPDRLDDAVYAVNGGYGRAGSVEKALTEQQQKVAGPLYKKLHTLEIDPTPQLIRDIEAAKKLGALADAEKMALADDVPFSLSSSQQKLGQGKIAMRDLDYIKRGLDSLIEGQTDTVTGKVTSVGRSYVEMKKRLVDELDRATSGQYKAARDAFAGPAALKSAIEQGKRFWGENAAKLEDAMADMTKSEQDAFRIGAAEALREKVGSPRGQTELLNMWQNRNIRERMKALLGDDVKYSDVQKLISNEATLKRLESLGPGRNSRTFSREAAAEDQNMGVAGDLVSLGMDAKTGAGKAILGGLQKNWSRISTPEPVRDAMGSILMGKYQPDEMKALLLAQELIRKQRAMAASGSGIIAGKGASGATGLLDD